MISGYFEISVLLVALTVVCDACEVENDSLQRENDELNRYCIGTYTYMTTGEPKHSMSI